MNALEKAMRRMGYRQMKKGIWGKPFGYHLLILNATKTPFVFQNWFKGVPKEPLLWDSCELNPSDKDYEEAIKRYEYSTKVDVGSPGINAVDFGFLTNEEVILEML